MRADGRSRSAASGESWSAVLLGKVVGLSVRHAALFVARCAREAWWVARCVPRVVAVLAVAVVVLVWAGRAVEGSVSAVGLLGLLGWPSLSPSSWASVDERVRWHRYRMGWRATAIAVGLSVPDPRGAAACGGGGGLPGVGAAAFPVLVPDLVKGSGLCGGVLTLRVRYAPGQSLADLEKAVPGLAARLFAHGVRVAPDGPGYAVITLALIDALGVPTATPWPAALPAGGGHPLAAVDVGRELSGDPWLVDARLHTVVVGATGSGKGSVMWSLLSSLAPAIHAGLVLVIGIDLKAGMELKHGRDLLSVLATKAAQAVAVLEDRAVDVQLRAEAMAGIARAHIPTRVNPHVLIIIDELAALLSYAGDKDLMRRADDALRIILTQGRAPGVSVWGWIQDPRKDAFPMRHLFVQAVGLRLKTASEVGMTLGDDFREVAPCHHIHRKTPGMGYAIGEDGHPIKVRAHYADDDHIHAITATYPTPHRLTLPELAPDPVKTAQEERLADLLGGRDTTNHDQNSKKNDRTPSGRAPRKPRTPRMPRQRDRGAA